MKLSETKKKNSVKIARDGEFESLGFVTHSNPNQLVYLEDAKYVSKMLKKSNISSVITTEELVSSLPKELGIGVSINPRKSFYEIHNHLAKDTVFYWTPFKTEISSNAKIHPTAYIAERNVRIGEGCEICPNVSILKNTILERDVIVRTGSVIGAEGFEFNRIGKKVLHVAHAGGVLINSRVEIQANCCIDKAVFNGFTEIGEDTKLDNLIHVAHNVVIGKRCLLAANAMVAGSVIIGNDVWIGPSATISSEILIGDGASITIGSVVVRDVASGQRVTGNFAIDHKSFISFLRKIR
ncbi:MAG: UDP-3-O-(3-hydroxymyristoyl)glucosamine N-acyltransferase [Deltaproteobacteria bacterium]|nr:UDP-3-O-(3-hydroxymyristoyl)glucosamine N-acyltransferase [Deltaproteobacteria bacterium]MBW2660944.1 UDP-3-O-(3-hydroxymyristoyl)glucosamine N-acyltransferase [Deltaproteobacteria bacterium]